MPTTLTTATELASAGLALPTDTYIYALARLSGSIAAIASNDSLTLVDPKTLKTKRTHAKSHAGITCLAARPGGTACTTAGRDGTVKVWDERMEASSMSLAAGNGQGLSALAVGGDMIAAGTENTKEGLGDVGVYVWDTRSPTSTLRSYTESHNDTITQLLFHANQPSLLLSASTDALITLLDTAHADEDDAVQQVFNNGGAVHRASFLSADEVAAVSTDERLAVYARSRPEDVEREDVPTVETRYGDVRAELKGSYVIDLVRAEGGEGETWVASGDLEQSALMLTPFTRGPSAAPTKYAFAHDRALSFPSAHGGEVVRDLLLDPGNGRVLTCGEDGLVKLWSVPASAGAGAHTAMEIEAEDGSGAEDVDGGKGRKRGRVEEKERRREKKRARKKGGKERFKPY